MKKLILPLFLFVILSSTLLVKSSPKSNKLILESEKTESGSLGHLKNAFLELQDVSTNEYDPVDIAALKVIRDNAPEGCTLKTAWDDDTKIWTSSYIGWSTQIPKKVVSITLQGMSLTSLDLSSFAALERLYCSNNKIASLNIKGLVKLTTLNCYLNNLTFSSLPLKSSISGEYIYQPQNSFDQARSISLGETIDYSSEALIDGVATAFKWYKNNVQIENTDESGKYSPNSEGYYYCQMTNSKFPGLIITTSLVKIGNPPEYDPQDILVLKAIRDNAPSDSPLKYEWADESRIGSWSGVYWSSNPSKRIIQLHVNRKNLVSLNVDQLPALEALSCQENKLTSINIDGLKKLKYFICNNNKLPYSKLPLKLPVIGSTYTYSPQEYLFEPRSITSGETIDYSSEAIISNTPTVFTWYKDNIKIENTEQTGKYAPTSDGYYYCVMSNSKFPGLVLTTNPVKLGSPQEFDPTEVAALKAIRDNAPANSPLKTKWANEANIGTWEGVYWTDLPSKRVKKLFVWNSFLTMLDVSKFLLLETLCCNNNNLEVFLINGLKNLKEVMCNSNKLAFSRLPLISSIPSNTIYSYSPQNKLYEERAINTGETIDYSFEAIINGKATVFSWYKDNVKIEGTDQTGKYTPTTDGYYYCVMTSAEFPQLSLTTNAVKAGTVPEFDPRDVEALKSIRDKAPSTSPLKTEWADEAKVGNWNGVIWTELKSRRVIGLSLYDKKLVELNASSLPELVTLSCNGGLNSINLTGLTKLTSLYCSGNNFTSIDLTGLVKLNSLDCRYNKIPFSKLPLRLPASGGYILYEPQNPLYEERKIALGEIIDYSSEALIGTKPTTFIWFKNGEKIEGTDQTGKYTPLSDGFYTCQMTNPNFIINSFSVKLTTNPVIVGNATECDQGDVAALKAIRDNAPIGSKPKIYWTDDSKILTWDGVIWSGYPTRRVIGLGLSDGILTGLDVSSLTSLKELNCSNNNLTFLKINPLVKFERLDCSNNKLTFSSLPVSPTVYSSGYNYTTYKLMDVERTINPGETIDYSSEALINGVNTVFKWYKNNELIDNADQSGKYIPMEEGYYCCKMTNSLFPNLTLASAPVRVGNPSLYDPQDVEALKAIRDNAPVDSPLKTAWSDETKMGSWSGVAWSSVKPYQVISLNVNNRKLTSIDVSSFKSLSSLNCSDNSLSTLDLRGLNELQHIECQYNNIISLNISGLTKINTLYCYSNKLTFSNLPRSSTGVQYSMNTQKPLFEERTIAIGETIDYSSEATFEGVSTVFTWYKNDVKIEGTDQTGRYSPTSEGFYTCKMTNAKFPNLVLSTSPVKLGQIEEYAPQDVATLKTIRDNAPSDSPLKTLWADESKIATWAGVYWSTYSPKKVIGLSIYDKKLKEVDLRLLSSLEGLDCYNNSITSLLITGLQNLKGINCSNNMLSAIDLSGSNNVNRLLCDYNNIPLSKLPLLPRPTGITSYEYRYYPQNDIYEEHSISLGETIDYSSEALIDGTPTIFTWYWGNFKIEDIDQSGKFTPTKDGYYYCTMTNLKFPNLVITTKKVKVGNPEEYSSQDIEALKTIRDNAPNNSTLKTLWADETKIGTWAGVGWSEIPTRRVRSLDLNNRQLTTLNIDKLSYLESLYCSNNNLRSIDVSGSNLNNLTCTNNLLTFSNIPLILPGNGTFKYVYFDPQKPLFEERTIVIGETIDFSSESLISGISTIFSWYRNGVKILNTDQSGKYTPTEEGYYYCTMTNSKFSGLTLTTNKITVGNPPEFDPQDVAALIAIRDNAPTGSRLKTQWTDESKIGSWSGVTWNEIRSKKVIYLDVSWALLKTINVSQLTFLEQLNCSYNQLVSVNLTGVNRLKEYNCSNNNLSFSNLLLRLPISGSNYSYNYSPQGLIYQPETISAGETIDYSAEVLFDGVSTVFNWYRDNVKIENTNQTGKFTPISEGYYYCTLTNAKFPKLTLTTNVVKVGNPPEFDPQDIVSLKSIRDNAPASSSLKTLWADDNNIGTWSGVVWSQFPIKKVKELNIRGCSLSTISISSLSSLEKLDCSNNYLKLLVLSMLPNLQSIYCNGNQLTSINIDGLTRLSTLYCQNNQLLFSKLPLKLPVQNGYYSYYGQSYPLTQQTLTIGSTIDYSSEALIDGVSTKYNWYRNGTLIAGTDNTGRYTISEDGYYFCVLSNSKFPELSITTSQIKIGNPHEYDPQDILTLKTIRDNAPSDSPLKMYWADDTKVGNWTGVIWSTYLPRKVTQLSLYNMKLSVLDVKQLTALEQLNCSYNQLAFVDISTLIRLYSFDCSFNKIPLSKLPLKLPSSYGTYSYSQQTPFGEEHSISIGETIDYSSEAIISGTATTFVWYKNNVKLEGTDNTGKLVPSTEGIYYCTMSNSKFNSLIITTGKTKVGNPIEFDPDDIAALKAIRDNAPSDSPIKTYWADEKPIGSWNGIYWNGIYPQKVKQLNLSSQKLTSLDVTKLTSLENIDCTYNQLKTLKVDGLPNLTSLSCTANQLETIDLTSTPKVKNLYCEYNKISLSKLPLKLLVPGGYYRYSPQNKIYNEKTISSGELIDFSSEATIDGVSTVFTWFKNNNKIENTDQSGKFVPTEDGYYYCQMTNLKFIGLTIVTNTIKIGTPPEFDQQDVDALKSIRDNAPANSLLKVNWVDDALIGSWPGVFWTSTFPKKVNRLSINNMQLTSIDVSKLKGLTQLYCSKNNLTTLDLSGLTLLSAIDCSYNKLSSINLTGIVNLNSMNCIENNFSFTTLPLLPYNINYYYSSPQKLLFEEKTIALGETIDFSLESIVRTQPTYFTWYKDNIRIDGTDQSGKYKPTANGVYYCTMVNYTFSNLTLTTNKIYVGKISDYNITDVEALKRIRDQSPADSPIKTEWADENQIGLWAGVVWSISSPKKVRELSIPAQKLRELDVSALASLEKLVCNKNELTELNMTGLLNLNYIDCSYNLITGISISNVTKVQYLYCNNNKIPFSALPVRLPVSSGTYEYSPMNSLYEERTSLVGEPINYTLESKIDGSLSDFSWYKNNVKIEGTDQTGKYIPSEEGEYHCKMTNSKFPGLTLTTNKVKVYKLPEFDMHDVEALKTLRDNAPADSPLKTQWADDSKFSSWEGVTWSDFITKKVKILQLSQKGLKMLDVTSFSGLEQLYCNNNQLTSLKINGLLSLSYVSCAYNQLSLIDISGLPKILNLFCHNNKLCFSKLPARLPVAGGNYQYWPQQLIFEEQTIEIGETIDYSSEALIYGKNTVFSWYKNNTLISGTDQSGRYRTTGDGFYHCVMTNANFPGLTLTTNKIITGILHEFDPGDVAALKAIHDNSPANAFVREKWVNISQVGSWFGVKWNNDTPKRIVELNVSNFGLISLDVTQLTMLERLQFMNNHLSSINLTGLKKLRDVYCVANQLTSIDLSGLPLIQYLDCAYNNFTFSALWPNISYLNYSGAYSPQYQIFSERSILLGQIIDYSSEANFGGVATTFTWYRNNVKIENTDNSGKYAPATDGYYHCTMTNSKFPGLTQQTSRILVVDKQPIANAGVDQIVNEGAIVSLDGTASIASGNGSLAYFWTSPANIELSSNTASKPTFTAPEVGSNTQFIFSLMVKEGTVSSIADQVLISVLHVNKAPVAIAGNYQEKDEGVEVTLDGSGSFDADGDALTYTWSAPSGITLSSTTDVNPTFTAPWVSQDTQYMFTLTVNDGKINSTKSEVIVKIRKGYPKVKLVSKLNNSMISAKDISYQLFSKSVNVFQKKNIASVTKGDTTLISLDPGEWIILASPSQNSSLFVPTYVGNVLTWNQAEHIIIPENGSVYKEISCTQSIPAIAGIGEISGYIVENDKTGTKSISIYNGSIENNKPIVGAMINLFKKGGAIPAFSVFSDSNGYYKFDHLEITDYEIVVELPGFTQSEKFGVKISDNAPLASVQFAVNTNFQTITDVNSIVLTGLKVYPNPVFDLLTIDLEEITSSSFVFVYNIKGELLFGRILDKSKTIIDFSRYPSGHYVVKVVIKDNFKSFVIQK